MLYILKENKEFKIEIFLDDIIVYDATSGYFFSFSIYDTKSNTLEGSVHLIIKPNDECIIINTVDFEQKLRDIGRLSTPAVTYSIKKSLEWWNNQKFSKIIKGLVHIQTNYPGKAITCYTHAFENNGFEKINSNKKTCSCCKSQLEYLQLNKEQKIYKLDEWDETLEFVRY